jgi:hypothetical protein
MVLAGEDEVPREERRSLEKKMLTLLPICYFLLFCYFLLLFCYSLVWVHKSNERALEIALNR